MHAWSVTTLSPSAELVIGEHELNHTHHVPSNLISLFQAVSQKGQNMFFLNKKKTLHKINNLSRCLP